MQEKLNRFLLLLTLISVLNATGKAETGLLNFRNYGPAEGLNNTFVYSVNQDPSGFMWFGAGAGLSRFDGFNFKIDEFEGQIPADLATATYTDKDERMWFGFNNGQIVVYEGKDFRILEAENVGSTIAGFEEDGQGNILAASHGDGLIRINNDMEIEVFKEQFSGMLLSSISFSAENRLLAGTVDGLYLYKYKHGEAPEIIKKIDAIPSAKIQAIEYMENSGTLLAGTENMGVYSLLPEISSTDSFHVVNTGEKWGLSDANVQHIFSDNENNIWISTFGEGVFKITTTNGETKKVTRLNEQNGLASNMIRQVFQDNEERYWFASYGGGISMLTDESLRIYPEPDARFGKNILSLTHSEDSYWLGGEKGILKMNPGKTGKSEFFTSAHGLPADRITALTPGEKGVLWAGTHESGLYRIDTQKKRATLFFSSRNTPENSVNSILFDKQNNKLWIGTNGGAFSFNPDTGERKRFGTDQGLPHNFIRYLYKDSENNIWAATRSRSLVNLTTQRDINLADRELNFTSLTEDVNGDLWAGTEGNGIIKIYSDTIRHFTTDEGLLSNYCYGITADSKGYVWVGHRQGISRINTDNNFIRLYGTDNGIRGNANYNSFFGNGEEKLLFGTTEGLIIFDGSKEKKPESPPKLNITGMQISDEETDYAQTVSLPYGSYKLNIDFIGLDYTNPQQVKYSYKLEGYDFDWSEKSTNQFAYYPRIDDGDYTFLLRAYNSDGLYNEIPLAIDLTISKPIWKKWYIYLALIVFTGSLFWTYIKIRESKLKKEKERIEHELAKRTKEVRKQKDEIETKNRDITDSINYAQRIQASILPSFEKLRENFSSSFVFYQPRDIVSGDFYWFDMVNRDKFIIVCADSTGHGVPGAFMSMIGTTLIKDICMRKEVNSPADVLQTLDREVTSTLNQNIESDMNSIDGMDITVCEIDVNTKVMRFASAMRPILILHNGELIYIRGSRNSIGGFMIENKTFDNQVFNLNADDIVYMFSDGFPDQFGGPYGKKFKMVRLRNLLADICEKPLEEQHKYIKNNFYLWKGKNEQVDDVLFMGIKV